MTHQEQKSRSPQPSGEFELIARIANIIGNSPAGVLGIGDDAAVIPVERSSLLLTVDMLMEGVDFLIPPATWEQVGHKALAVNLSDIAAMGGTPTYAVVSLALPQGKGEEIAIPFYEGMMRLARRHNVSIVGGDTNSWDQPFAASITVLGIPSSQGPLLRSAAQPGDWIFVTGSLGGSILGHHLTFEPRIAEARELQQLVPVHAMIDVSDGFAADLHHILDVSRVGATIDRNQIPIREAAFRMNDQKSPLEHALSDGEDFELIFTVAPTEGPMLLNNWAHPTPITHVGTITADRRCLLVGGHDDPTPLLPVGWVHSI